MTPRFAGFEAKVRESLARQGAVTAIGAEVEAIEPGLVRLSVAHAPSLLQHNGYFHAGIQALLGDTAGGYAGLTLLDAQDDILTVEFKMNCVAPARGDRLVATGRVLKAGRTLIVCGVEVSGMAGGVATISALLQQTLMVMRPR